jgi:hypothetical protein
MAAGFRRVLKNSVDRLLTRAAPLGAAVDSATCGAATVRERLPDKFFVTVLEPRTNSVKRYGDCALNMDSLILSILQTERRLL